jgi:hypothetical protein
VFAKKEKEEEDFMFADESKERSSVSKNRLKGAKLAENIFTKKSPSFENSPDKTRGSRKVVKSKQIQENLFSKLVEE